MIHYVAIADPEDSGHFIKTPAHLKTQNLEMHFS